MNAITQYRNSTCVESLTHISTTYIHEIFGLYVRDVCHY